MPSSVYRVVLVADQFDPKELIKKLLQAGLKPAHIHVSHDHHDPALASLGVQFGVSCGRLHIKWCECQKKARDWSLNHDHLVP